MLHSCLTVYLAVPIDYSLFELASNRARATHTLLHSSSYPSREVAGGGRPLAAEEIRSERKEAEQDREEEVG